MKKRDTLIFYGGTFDTEPSRVEFGRQHQNQSDIFFWSRSVPWEEEHYVSSHPEAQHIAELEEEIRRDSNLTGEEVMMVDAVKDLVKIHEWAQRSHFCYNPLGQGGGDSNRYIVALLFQCIPIFVKRDTPPFHRLLGDLWKEAALFVEPEEAGDAARAVSSTDRERMRIAGQGLIEMLLWTRLKYEEYISEDGMHDSLWALAREMELIIASDSEKSVKGQAICRNHFPNW